MWDEIKRTFSIFKTPTPIEMATRELTEAERALLEAQSGREFADAMVTYHSDRIDRLRRFLRDAHEDK